ncbi:MAG: hypothetical protein ACLQU1_04445 [Bryobacteraceae bacterium]
MDDPSLPDNRKDPNLARYLPDFWLPHPGKNRFNLTLDRAIQKKAMEVTAMMFGAGVRLLAGTDTGFSFVLPGFGLHDELDLMVSAGLAVSAVLHIAELAPLSSSAGRANSEARPAANWRTCCCSMPTR